MSSWPFVGAIGTLLTAGGTAAVVVEVPDPTIDTIAGLAAIAGLGMIFAVAVLWMRQSFERD